MTETGTSVTGVGSASAPYEKATFSITVEERAQNGPEAKERLRPIIDNVNTVLDELTNNGVTFCNDSRRTSFSVTPNLRYDGGRQTRDGYNALATLLITTTDINRVTEIQDRLTSVEGVSVNSPSFDFSPEKAEELNRNAFRAAHENVNNRFNAEVETFGFKRDDYVVGSWDTRYDNSRPTEYAAESVRMGAAGDVGGGPPPVGIEAGMGTVTVRLTVTFERRN